jgi:hypothetical protein
MNQFASYVALELGVEFGRVFGATSKEKEA